MDPRNPNYAHKKSTFREEFDEARPPPPYFEDGPPRYEDVIGNCNEARKIRADLLNFCFRYELLRCEMKKRNQPPMPWPKILMEEQISRLRFLRKTGEGLTGLHEAELVEILEETRTGSGIERGDRVDRNGQRYLRWRGYWVPAPQA
ncbi:MAG: hypothetical protein Q9227_006588 [Pyrenula ochraceoflavens]